MNPITSETLDFLRLRTADNRDLSERPIDTGDDCRNQAAEFVAQAKRNPEHERHFVTMAQSWLRLAVRADLILALKDRAGSVMRRNKNFKP